MLVISYVIIRVLTASPFHRSEYKSKNNYFGTRANPNHLKKTVLRDRPMALRLSEYKRKKKHFGIRTNPNHLKKTVLRECPMCLRPRLTSITKFQKTCFACRIRGWKPHTDSASLIRRISGCFIKLYNCPVCIHSHIISIRMYGF